MRLNKFICKICGYEWYPRKEQLPKQCPSCKRYDWNKNKEVSK